MQWILRHEKDLMPYVEAIETASTETIEIARPQLFQALEMVKETMRTRCFRHGYEKIGLLKDKRTASDVVDTILDAVTDQGQAHLEAALREPGNERRSRGWPPP